MLSSHPKYPISMLLLPSPALLMPDLFFLLLRWPYLSLPTPHIRVEVSSWCLPCLFGPPPIVPLFSVIAGSCYFFILLYRTHDHFPPLVSTSARPLHPSAALPIAPLTFFVQHSSCESHVPSTRTYHVGPFPRYLADK